MAELSSIQQGKIEEDEAMLVFFNALGEKTAVTKSVNKILGYTEEEYLKLRWENLIAPNEIESTIASLQKLLLNPSGTSSLHCHAKHKNGNWLLLECTMHNFLHIPTINAVLIHYRDITESNAENLRIKEQEMLLREAQNIARLGSFRLDISSNIWEGTEMLYSIMGIDEHFNRTRDNWVNLIHPKFKKETISTIESQLQQNKTFSYIYPIIRQLDKQERWVHVRGELVKDNQENKEYLLGTIIDITEQKRYEETLLQNENMLRVILENMPVGIWITDKNGKINFGNAKVKEIWGGSKFVDVNEYPEYKAWWPNGNRVETHEWGAYRALNRGETSINEEIEIETFDCKRKFILNSAIPLLNKENEIIGVVVVNQDITNRKQNEKTIEQSAQFLESILDNLPNPVFIKNIAHEWVFVNNAFCCLMARQKEEIIGKSDYAFFPKAEADVFWEKDNVVFKTGNVNKNIELFTDGFGLERTIITIKSIHKDIYDNKILLGVISDITKQKQIEEALRKSELEYIALIQNIQVAVVVHSADTRIVKCNQQAESLLGLRSDIILGKESFDSDWHFFSEDGKELSVEEYPVNVVLSTNKPIIDKIYGIHRGSNLSDVWVLVHANPVYDENGLLTQVIVSFIDISERKQINEQMRISNANLNSIIESSESSIWLIDKDYRIVELNTRFKNYFKTAFHVDLEHNMRIVDSLTEPYKAMWKERYDRALKGEKFVELDTFEIKEVPHYTLSTFNPIYVNNSIIGVSIFSQDITEQKLYEQKLLEINATKDKFFSIIAHDLRNPFNSILGLTELLSTEAADYSKDEMIEIAKQVHASATKTFHLLNNLLQWAHAQTGKVSFQPIKCKLADIINKELEILLETASKKNIILNTAISHDFELFADVEMLKTIMRNLVNNAIKYTSNGGRIDLVTLNRNGENLIIVADNGVGISKNVQSNLFRIENNISTYGTNNEKGSGLGLSICKEFMERHQGRIWVESEEGKGSKFFVAFPSR